MAEEKDPGVVQIVINFPTGVTFPGGFEQALDALVNMVCEKYEAEHPDRTMWPAGHGGGHSMFDLHDDAPHFDMSVYQIDVAEREANERELERRSR